ncbi:hypothetical protein Ddye_011819 [Dipteronia dyeriana]|uniref:Uncharacterized protein n=1 Tax=Dipteronia dyeriana TaxID=168575 RepID=A0AAD9X352_9ROSI|nr:hypothetical protein Ddye_011819 [Dipteronia dyeriana]
MYTCYYVNTTVLVAVLFDPLFINTPPDDLNINHSNNKQQRKQEIVSSMAGLQYNFFPTDILYPRASSKSVAAVVETTTEKSAAAAAAAAALPLDQYYFFPTDYLYPRPSPSLKLDATRSRQIKSKDKLPLPTTITFDQSH